MQTDLIPGDFRIRTGLEMPLKIGRLKNDTILVSVEEPKNIKYYSSLGFTDQDAFYHNSATYYKQYSGRLNLDVKLNEYVSANVGLHARREDRNYPTESAGAIFRMLMRGRPTEPEVWPNGKPGPDIENGQNPYVITTNATGYTSIPSDILQLNAGVDITNPWIEGLKLTLSGAVDQNNTNLKNWQTPWELYFWDRVSFEADGVTPLLEPAIRSNFTDPRLTQVSSRLLNTNLTALLSFERSINDDHGINILAGVTREEFTGDNFLAFRRNYVSSAIDQLFAGGTAQQNTDGSGYGASPLRILMVGYNITFGKNIWQNLSGDMTVPIYFRNREDLDFSQVCC